MTQQTTRDDHVAMVADCIQRESKLSDWERGFIDSLDNRLGAGFSLTDKQAARLDDIWEKVT